MRQVDSEHRILHWEVGHERTRWRDPVPCAIRAFGSSIFGMHADSLRSENVDLAVVACGDRLVHKSRFRLQSVAKGEAEFWFLPAYGSDRQNSHYFRAW